MCGIFFSYSQSKPSPSCNLIYDCLDRRGPDGSNLLSLEIRESSLDYTNECDLGFVYLTFYSSVLSLRGDKTIKQPLQDPSTGSIFCWNGEAWNFNDQPVIGNDTEIVFELLLRATEISTTKGKHVSSSDDETAQGIVSVLSSISGPASFVFYEAQNQRIFYGRDSLGRRSLLQKRNLNGNLSISSVRPLSDSSIWDEVEAGDIRMLDLKKKVDAGHGVLRTIASTKDLLIPHINHETLNTSSFVLNFGAPTIDILMQKLFASLSHRVLDVPGPPGPRQNPPRVAIMFSGGLDCAVLARLVHHILPKDNEIDLLNTAFENPRVVKAAKIDKSSSLTSTFSPYALCPDRITGLSTLEELLRVCPGRVWRFVSIDISYAESRAHQREIISLIHPHKSEMDLSIACAFYFAARGVGTVLNQTTGKSDPYECPARVFLSGLGADELFAGYTRHATAYNRNGYRGLVDELELDFQRLGKRNLGRDDRVISHWGREVRYPYLDQNLINWALGLPVWEKCGFGNAQLKDDYDDTKIGTVVIEPGKKLLRLLAWRLDMKGAAVERKRAIQFGARTAKMEVAKAKGSQELSYP